MDRESTEVRHTTYEGFGFGCRIVRITPRPSPCLSPVLIVGGAFQDQESWKVHQRYLVPHADLITVDLPGSGSADSLPPCYGADFLASALEHLLTQIECPRVNLVGLSYGTFVTYRFAQAHPHRIARMALCGMSDRLTANMRVECQNVVTLLRSGRLIEFTETVLTYLIPHLEQGTPDRKEALTFMLRSQLGKLSPETAAQYADNYDRLLKHPRIRAGIQGVPVLVFTGEHDLCTPPETGRRVAEGIPGSSFTTVADAGHLVSLERPREFTELLIHFFSGRRPGDLPYCI